MMLMKRALWLWLAVAANPVPMMLMMRRLGAARQQIRRR